MDIFQRSTLIMLVNRVIMRMMDALTAYYQLSWQEVEIKYPWGSTWATVELTCRTFHLPDNHSTNKPQLNLWATAQPLSHSSTFEPQLNHWATAQPLRHSSTSEPQLIHWATAHPLNHSSSTEPQLIHWATAQPRSHSSSTEPQLIHYFLINLFVFNIDFVTI